MDDPVAHPRHYTVGKIEVLDFIIDQDLPHLPACALKYICRYRWKGNPAQDIRKAIFYLERLAKEIERRGE